MTPETAINVDNRYHESLWFVVRNPASASADQVREAATSLGEMFRGFIVKWLEQRGLTPNEAESVGGQIQKRLIAGEFATDEDNAFCRLRVFLQTWTERVGDEFLQQSRHLPAQIAGAPVAELRGSNSGRRPICRPDLEATRIWAMEVSKQAAQRLRAAFVAEGRHDKEGILQSLLCPGNNDITSDRTEVTVGAMKEGESSPEAVVRKEFWRHFEGIVADTMDARSESATENESEFLSAVGATRIDPDCRLPGRGPDSESGPSNNSSEPAEAHGTPTTLWSIVVHAADPESPKYQTAMARLYERYRETFIRWIRRRNIPEDDVADLLHALFERLLTKRMLARVDPAQGRFRSFMFSCVARLCYDYWRDRGQEPPMTSLDAPGPDGRPPLEPACASPEPGDEEIGDWARVVLGHTEAALRLGYVQRKDLRTFEVLHIYIYNKKPGLTYADAGKILGISEDAVKKQVERMRRRFRELLRMVVAETIADRSLTNIDAEIEVLRQGLRGL